MFVSYQSSAKHFAKTNKQNMIEQASLTSKMRDVIKRVFSEVLVITVALLLVQIRDR